MPTNLDFNTTKGFRDFIIGRTLPNSSGPQSFTATSYSYNYLNDYENKELGDVTNDLSTLLASSSTKNVFKPENYPVIDYVETRTIGRTLDLYPYFDVDLDVTLLGILTTDSYENQSELFKFNVDYIKNDSDGPLKARISQNIQKEISGRFRLLDALQGNSSTAINILTGKEPLIEPNFDITVPKSGVGKVLDFVGNVAGTSVPYSIIPGNYLTNPADSNASDSETTLTGALKSIVGLSRSPKTSENPSEIMLNYMGSGQKRVLFDCLRYSTYKPDYSKNGSSQQSNKTALEKLKDVFGLDAPVGNAYIGDDSDNDVKYAMSDFNGVQIHSSYYLSYLFDPVQTRLLQREKNITEYGSIASSLTWYSDNSKNELGLWNEEYNSESTTFLKTLSNEHEFREDSILGKTQEILNTMPVDGGAARSHVANVIDQTSRVFREGETMMSRGSAIKYTDMFTGTETGREYCRVWTKDRSYLNYSDTMKRTGPIRKFDASVMSTPWNLNIAPMSNGNGSFEGSSNIFERTPGSGDFYAKKYMFSIENLAWKTSNTPGFTYQDLPYCERGNNEGRVMWFPPYDLKVNEQNNANWEANKFLGRPEPIYTYQNTERNGTIQFKILADHPSILNLMVNKVFKDMSDEESDNFINAFFAGCEEMDLYALVRKYAMLSKDDIEKIQDYINSGKSEVITKYKKEFDVVTIPDADNGSTSSVSSNNKTFKGNFKFNNDYPKLKGDTNAVEASQPYDNLYTNYINFSGNTNDNGNNTYIGQFRSGCENLWVINNEQGIRDHNIDTIFFSNSQDKPVGKKYFNNIKADFDEKVDKQVADIIKKFTDLESEFTEFDNKLNNLKDLIEEDKIDEITVTFFSSTSSITDDNYNYKLSARRSHSVLQYIFNTLSVDGGITIPTIKWLDASTTNLQSQVKTDNTYNLKDFGYETSGKIRIKTVNVGENVDGSTETNYNSNANNQERIKSFGVDDTYNKNLQRTAPITFETRQTEVKVEYNEIGEQTTSSNLNSKVKTKLTPYNVTSENDGGIDEMKRIIMKTLGECYYFKILEEESPVAFASLKEKLRYFHPAFHSMTPEGLNTRLTFLQQCIRPGDTIPVKGLTSEADLNARNTSFGPPPICVLRIGDFYHSKVIIRDVNFDYDDGVWDLNPEGIGVQPMLINVTLQMSFIGGQGLEKPVERLQNALTSNFFANTEMFDPRSISTNTKIGGVDAETFTKEYLEELQRDYIENNNSDEDNNIEPESEIAQGTYIGGSGESLSYGVYVDDIQDYTQKYFDRFITAYNDIYVNYGPKIVPLMFSSARIINEMTINTSDTTTDSINLIGLYKKSKELSVLTQLLVTKINEQIDEQDIAVLLGFSKIMSKSKRNKANDLLKPFLKDLINTKITNLNTNNSINGLEVNRTYLINNLDKTNHIIKYGRDSCVNDTENTYATLSGFTYDLLYNEYDHCIQYIKTNHDLVIQDVDYTIDFNNPVIIEDDLIGILSILMGGEENNINSLFEKNQTIFSDKMLLKINEKIGEFILYLSSFTITLPTLKNRPSDDDLTFNVLETGEVTDQNEIDEIKKIFSSQVTVTDKLNFYKP